MHTYSASVFKAKCLAILDEVARTGEPVTITKRGKPVAQVIRTVKGKARYPQDDLVGTVEILGDIIEPPLPPDAWEAEASGPEG